MTTKEPAKPEPKTRKSRNNVSYGTQEVSENTGLDSDIVKSDDSVKETSGKRKNLFDGKPGPGRPKGIPNKMTTAAKDAIAKAADALGGPDRLVAWAQEDPLNERAFWTSIYPKLLPLQVTGDPNQPVHTVSTLNVTGLSTQVLAEIMKARDDSQPS